LLKLPVAERLQRRIIDGESKGLPDDLDLALADRPALDIINTDLLAGMKVVGELFGSGQMQLPFVLQSAEVMKSAVAYLEPHLEKADSRGKGTIVLATVKGDVHDIGKNLVDIILTNNGYTVVNLGIKQPIARSSRRPRRTPRRDRHVRPVGQVDRGDEGEPSGAQRAGDRHRLSGLPRRRRTDPAYVEQDLREVFAGEVRYARDAFEGLRLMDALMAVKRGEEGAALPRRGSAGSRRGPAPARAGRRTGAGRATALLGRGGRVDVPTPPFWVTGSSRASRWPTSRPIWTSERPSWGSGA
jgi:5-methyltetrahydrofolate--homocysteine methyltransferase